MAELTQDWLRVYLYSFADLTVDHLARIGDAFDAHPALRPRKVGGDPARITVEPDLRTLLTDHGLPVDWLTVRRHGRWPDFEGGDLSLRRGRGSWSATIQPGGEPTDLLVRPHSIEQSWLKVTLDEVGVDEVVALVRDLADAFDACYGVAGRDHQAPPLPHYSLGEVGWLNVFGPAFVERWPDLAGLGEPLAHGGRLVLTHGDPWAWPVRQDPALREALGEQPFSRPRFGGVPEPGTYVPWASDHFRFSPGTDEMPWVAGRWERRERDERAAYDRARRRLERALARREETPVAAEHVEWSSSLDLDQWQDLWRHLRRRLGGDLSGSVGRALAATIDHAPHEAVGSLVLATRHGPLSLEWRIGDVAVVDVWLFGPAGVHDLCEAWAVAAD